MATSIAGHFVFKR